MSDELPKMFFASQKAMKRSSNDLAMSATFIQ